MNHEGTKDTKEMGFEPISNRVENAASAVVDVAVKVHKALGPGLLESVYETCICYELSKRAIAFRRQVELPVRYDEVLIEAGFRIDVLVDECVIVELKAVDKVIPVHEAQLLTYMKLAGVRVGFILNFNVPLLKDGIKRMAL
jgi:GxxExxY protein